MYGCSQTYITSRWQYHLLKVMTSLPGLDQADIATQTAVTMMVEVGASGHLCFWIGAALQKGNQANCPFSVGHYSRPVLLIASQVLLSGAEAASQAEISSADHLTAPPIRIGAGIFPHELSLKIWRLERLSFCPKVFAFHN